MENSKLRQNKFQGEGLSLSKTKNPSEVIPKNEFSTKPLAPNSLTPLPHQEIALEWILKNLQRRRALYYAADAGLGKTIVAALLSNSLPGYRFYYVCPPFLESNTDEEFSKWCFEKNLYTFADSMITKAKAIEPFEFDLAENEKRVLIVDEAHRFKNEKTLRYKALLKIAKPFEHIIFLSGTPMPNSRPLELWPILRDFAPDVCGTKFFPFALRFCNAHKDESGFWNFEGTSRLPEFKMRLFKSFMLRQKKALLNLPPKIESVLTVGEGIPAALGPLEKTIRELVGDEDLTEAKIAMLHDSDNLHLATYRRLLGEYKLKFTLPIILNILEETDESILIFGWHKEVIRLLADELKEYQPLVITGDVAKEKRKPLVDEFQKDKSRRVFIGNIAACGVGFTLTKASRVLFIEQSWRDGDNSQASDRAHRIGQTGTVNVQYVALKNSFDSKMLALNLSKRKKSI